MHAENLAKAVVQIDIGELHVRGHGNAAVGAGKPERAFGDAAKGLRFADGHIELAVAHIGGDRGSPQLRGGYFDIGGRKPKIEIEIAKAVELIGS